MNTFTADGREFRAALAKAMLAHERRNTTPILGMVRITAADGKLALCITDLDIELTVTMDAETTGRIDTTADPKMLAGLLRWADGAVTVAQDGGRFTLSAGDLVAEWQEVCPAADWIAFQMDAAVLITVPGAALFKALDKVRPCISTEETRYYLNGIYMHQEAGNLRTAATDGRRLARYDAGFAWPMQAAILHTKAVSVLCSMIGPKSNGDVAVAQMVLPQKPVPEFDRMGKETGKMKDQPPLVRFTFSGDGWTMRTKTIDGTYPNYSRVIPAPDSTISFTLSAAQLRRFHGGPHGQAIKIDPDAGRMTQRDPDGATISMPVTGKGPSIGFNLKYLMAFAKPAGTIRVESKGPMEPASVITDDPALLQVLMPMKV